MKKRFFTVTLFSIGYLLLVITLCIGRALVHIGVCYSLLHSLIQTRLLSWSCWQHNFDSVLEHEYLHHNTAMIHME